MNVMNWASTNSIITDRRRLNMETQQRICWAVFLLMMNTVILAVPSDCARDLPPQEKQANPATLFVFGDSLFDAGNNNFIHTTTNFQANFPPYGKTFFSVPTGRFCDGRLIPDFIAEFANIPLVSPFLGSQQYFQMDYGFNFASAGAGALAQTHSGLVIDLRGQLENFKKIRQHLEEKFGTSATEQVVANAVYLFSIGSNDYMAPNSTLFESVSTQEYIEMVVSNITAVLQEIYDNGGRKFGLLNLGPLGCIPAARAANASAGGNGGCKEAATFLAQSHNALLSIGLRQLQLKLKDFKYSYFDSFSNAVEAQANPSKFGFKEVKTACCGVGPFRGVFSCGGKREVQAYELCSDPQNFMFWDSIHPSEAANLVSAQTMWAGSLDIVGPFNLQTLFQMLP